MSMIGHFYLLDAVTWRRLVAQPSQEVVERLVDGAYAQADDPRFVDVEKAWHGLHFLLTGTAWEGEPPLDFIVRGGIELGDDIGYGPARGFAPAEVAALAAALEPLTVDQLTGRFDAERMKALEIYPGGWSTVRLDDPDVTGYFTDAFERVQRLVLRGRDEGAALLTWLS